MNAFCSILSHFASFYDKVHIRTIDRVLVFKYTYANLCTSEYLSNLWTPFNFLKVGYYQSPTIPTNHNCFRQSQFI